MYKAALEPGGPVAEGAKPRNSLFPRPGQRRRIFQYQLDPGLSHGFQHHGARSRGQMVGGGFLVLKKVVRRFDGIRAVTQLWETASRMDGHRLSKRLDAGAAPDIGSLRSCKRFFCPSLRGVAHTTLPCITPSLSLVTPL